MKVGKCTNTLKKNIRSVAKIEYGALHSSMDILFFHTTLTLFNIKRAVYLI